MGVIVGTGYRLKSSLDPSLEDLFSVLSAVLIALNFTYRM